MSGCHLSPALRVHPVWHVSPLTWRLRRDREDPQVNSMSHVRTWESVAAKPVKPVLRWPSWPRALLQIVWVDLALQTPGPTRRKAVPGKQQLPQREATHSCCRLANPGPNYNLETAPSLSGLGNSPVCPWSCQGHLPVLSAKGTGKIHTPLCLGLQAN